MIGYKGSQNTTGRNDAIAYSGSCTKWKRDVVNFNHGLDGYGAKIVIEVAEIERGESDVADH